MPGKQFVRARGTPGPRLVDLNRGSGIEQRLHDAPGLLDAVLAGEMAGIAVQRIAEEAFVGFGCLAELLGEHQGQVHRPRRLCSRSLGLNHQIGTGAGIDAQDELIGCGRVRGE